MLLSLEQEWSSLLREMPEVQLIEKFKTRCHVVQEQRNKQEIVCGEQSLTGKK